MNFLIVLGVFIVMEGATWLIHRYIMHGFLWVLHRDHHDHSNEGKLERNDLFFFIFASPAIALLYLGVKQEFSYWFYIGLGISLYGMAYFFVHDIFIHQRAKVFTKTKNPYLLAIRRAHKQHHKHLGKEKGECFGFLWVPVQYFKMYFDKK
ncbi:Fatty acid hydroxylase superfamily [Chryseobacterium gleum]|jgi:beta-carotene 3-hydroxylase|uniref:Fatty acid hydroxylase superfamily n=2 Tax=Chryseobacterium gleum TaxID=250 RepID=A0A3S4QYU7_CHRGE|nr:sterol desaturase family protein [Chryseobacterium gleum]EFK35235.1 fatty acid hydroxylase superfamily [Chryseobacterium gleum ATCC 35910]MCE4063598.1 sterol desaturase family protein [Chryseobacterium gleum]QBJ84894.1 beta-carotene hydroxylase [Chryseobacterium gleum]QQY31025.1 sterol desaturase family protein [Chryseobacterium gleum]VEE04605.1 Fatty acid hydroxylase superfamily [Chryseobacterium gleum]